MSIAGDAKQQVEAFAEEVGKAVTFCAAQGENAKVINTSALQQAMQFVPKKASQGTTKVSAAAALTLISSRNEIFFDYPNLPRPHAESCGGKGFLPGVAHRLAESIAKSIEPDWPDNEVASHQLRLILADIADRADSIQWDSAWRALETQLTEVLDAYRLTEAEAAVKFPSNVQTDNDQEPGTDKPTTTPQTPKVRRLRLATVMVVVLSLIVGAGTTVGVFALVPAIPKALFGPKLVDSYPIPPMPEGPKELYSPTALPNTTVKLFAMTDGPRPSADAQTVNGWLPDVAALPVSTTYDSVTFQVWLSVIEPGVNPDTDRGLEMWIDATPPMVVTDSKLMLDEVHEGPDKTELDSVFVDGLLNGGTSITVDPLPPDPNTPVIYQFQVHSESEDSNDTYPCGFNPVSVTVAVKLKGNDKAVVTPYQLYVPRGKSC